MENSPYFDYETEEDRLHQRAEGCGCHSCKQQYENFKAWRQEGLEDAERLLFSTIAHISAVFWFMRDPDHHTYVLHEDGEFHPIPFEEYDEEADGHYWFDKENDGSTD